MQELHISSKYICKVEKKDIIPDRFEKQKQKQEQKAIYFSVIAQTRTKSDVLLKQECVILIFIQTEDVIPS